MTTGEQKEDDKLFGLIGCVLLACFVAGAGAVGLVWALVEVFL